MEPADLSGSPGKERKLVHGRVKARSGQPRPHMTCHSRAEARKPIDELVRVDVEPVRPSVVEQIPNHLDADFLGGIDVWIDGGKVVGVGNGLYAMPADRVSNRADAHRAQRRIIIRDELIVLRCPEHVEPDAMLIDVAG